MNTQKVSFKIYKELLTVIKASFNDLPISRDAFLNQLIKVECERLDQELSAEQPLTDAQNRYISGELKKLGTHQINVVLDKDVADRLNEIVSRRNLVRDAFINRLLFLLRSPDGFLKMQGVSLYLSSDDPEGNEWLDDLPTKPLELISKILNDPLYFLRYAIRQNQSQGDDEIYFYRQVISEKFIGFSCQIDDSWIPNTEDYAYWHSTETEKAIAALEQPFVSQADSE